MSGSSPTPCPCGDDDPAVARATLRKAHRTDTLVDDSHFGVSISHCAICRHQFLSFFCEQVDWVDSDDPQAWVQTPISDAEAAALRALPNPTDEAALLRIIATPRRFLRDLAPKGAPRTLAWVTGIPYIPAHD